MVFCPVADIRKHRRNQVKNRINADVLLKDFWRDNDRFADLFNTILFQGKRVLEPADLQEMDTDVSGMIELKDYNETISRARDVIKRTAYGIDFVVYGVENQDKIHYAMPLRTMIYDGLGYLKEYKEISRSNRKHGNIKTQEEFLSGMRKEDRLHPIITIVIYYNEKEWDGPCSLLDMMTDVPCDMKEIFSNYKMNLLQVSKSGQYRFSNEDVETVFKISRDIYAENFDEIEREYKNRDINAELAAVIGKITDSNYIIQKATDGREVLNMCTALEKLRNQGFEQGRSEGEAKLALLITRLLDDNKIEDLKRVSQDSTLRKKLYKEYSL